MVLAVFYFHSAVALRSADFTQASGTSSTTTNAGDLTGAPANLAAGDTLTINGNITTTGSHAIEGTGGGAYHHDQPGIRAHQ